MVEKQFHTYFFYEKMGGIVTGLEAFIYFMYSDAEFFRLYSNYSKALSEIKEYIAIGMASSIGVAEFLKASTGERNG